MTCTHGLRDPGERQGDEGKATQGTRLRREVNEVLQSVSDSVRPHRRQSTRLPRPWDSPGSQQLEREPEPELVRATEPGQARRQGRPRLCVCMCFLLEEYRVLVNEVEMQDRDVTPQFGYGSNNTS